MTVSKTTPDELSPRERQVYEYTRQGWRSDRIARELGVTRSAVTQAKSAARRKGYHIAYEPKNFENQRLTASENLLQVLTAIGNGKSSVKAIAQATSLHAATVKAHLATLRTQELVRGAYNSIVLIGAARDEYAPDNYDELYSDDPQLSTGGPSVAYFEKRFAEMGA